MIYYDGKSIVYSNYDENLGNFNIRNEDVPDEELPTGVPVGPSPTPLIPQVPDRQVPETVMSSAYLPGYLKEQIGKTVRVEYLIGTTGPLLDRIGELVDVGASYIVLKPVQTDDLLVSDLYSIKFVTVYQ